MKSDTPCPCGNELSYQHCCLPYHLKNKTAENAEILMRSRYCAFVVKQFQYLIDTHHPKHLGGLTLEILMSGSDSTQWLGLDVVEHTVNKKSCTATVTFKAWYLNGGDIDAIFESSDFINENGLWFYTTGKQFTADLPKRNDKCVCHSDKKFKACCMKLMR